MGRIVELIEAKNTECKCYDLDGEEICWSKGIIGVLNDSQEEKFCTVKNVSPISKEYESHIKKFKEMAKISDKCLEKEVKNTWTCVEKEAEEKQ